MITRTDQALQRRRMSRRIRETVAQRRYTATLRRADQGEDAVSGSPEHVNKALIADA